jgi:hypothetical protein
MALLAAKAPAALAGARLAPARALPRAAAARGRTVRVAAAASREEQVRRRRRGPRGRAARAAARGGPRAARLRKRAARAAGRPPGGAAAALARQPARRGANGHGPGHRGAARARAGGAMIWARPAPAAALRRARRQPPPRPARPTPRPASPVRALPPAARRQVAKLLALPAAAGTLLAAGNAQAATELAQVAASDGRLGTISLLFLPALGWVAFNMLGPLTNQLNRMSEMASEDAKPAGKKRRGVAGAVGLGAALSLAAAQQADAATELAQLGASDGR